MPFSSKKKAVTAREADPEAIPISTPRYFLTLHIDPCAPGPQFSLFTQVVWAPGAQGSLHRIILTRVSFRAQIDGVSDTPSVAQMMPQTRHYVDSRLVFDVFKVIFKDHAGFTRVYDVSSWKSVGAQLFSRNWFVPGALFSAHPHQV